MIDSAVNFVKDHAFAVTVIVIITFFAHGLIMTFSKRLVRRALRPEKFKNKLEERRREDTLISTLNAVVRVGVWIISGLLLLSEFGIDIAPLLAGAGIAGVALGFGAQSMVKDFLAGFFILIENHYRVGDVVELNQTVSGVVEHVTLRETVLRDLDGMVHHIPNGEITISTNMTLEFSGINLDVGIGYDTDIVHLEKVINDVGEDLANDDEWKDKIIEAPKFLRINEFGESAIMIKIVAKTEAMKQWSVTGELRKRLKIAFDKNGIEIPYPQRVIHEAPKSKSKKQR